jgi:DHA2 family metal-tetracycline-proton antiporter-like MFS transporter
MELKVNQQTGEILMRIVMFTLILSSMSVLMFIYVLPDISKEFHLSLSQVSWLSSSYGIIYAIGTVTYGKLADRFQLKNLLTFGLVIFAIGSLIGLLSQTFWMALIGRCMQAIGAGAIPATATLIPVRYFPPEKRGRALGMMAVGLALGSALGPVVSALIASFANWRWLFVVPMLILLTLPFYRKYLEDHTSKSHDKFDWTGSALLGVSVVFFMLSVTNQIWWLLVVAFLSIALFVIRIRVAKQPFIPAELFSNNRYTLYLVISFLINGIGTSLYFLTPIFLSEVQKLSTFWIGFAMVPATVASAILGRQGGKLADSKGNASLYFLASSLLVICFVLLSSFIGSPAWLVAIILVLGNVGQSFMIIVMLNSASQTLSKDQVGVGMGILQMLNFISQGVGTAIYSSVVDTGSTVHWNPISMNSIGYVYSNIFLVLAVLHIFIFFVYYYQFGRVKSNSY